MSLDMRHSDIECTLGGKNGAESVNVVAVALVAERVEQPSRRPNARVAATKEPTNKKGPIHKVGVITAPGLIAA